MRVADVASPVLVLLQHCQLQPCPLPKTKQRQSHYISHDCCKGGGVAKTVPLYQSRLLHRRGRTGSGPGCLIAPLVQNGSQNRDLRCVLHLITLPVHAHVMRMHAHAFARVLQMLQNTFRIQKKKGSTSFHFMGGSTGSGTPAAWVWVHR